MATVPQPPVIVKPIPSIITNEGAPFGPLILSDYIQAPDHNSGDINFYAALSTNMPLPPNFICTEQGLLGGVAADGTAGTYELDIYAKNDAEQPLITQINLTINPRINIDDPQNFNQVKKELWDSLANNTSSAAMTDVINRPITSAEIYYLMQRFAVLSIWDVYNLETPTDKILLNLPGNSPHYNIYDRGNCLVAAPKDLFSHDRTLGDAIQASKVMAREVYKKGWTIEFSGFNKMVRAAWIELKVLGDRTGKHLEILHYTPSVEDMKIYGVESNRSTGPSI